MSDRFTPSPELLALRREIDACDQKLAQMLCDRLKLILKAAPLKPRLSDVRLEDRIAEVIANVAAVAEQNQVDRAYIEAIYRLMMNESIHRETILWLHLNPKSS